MSWHRVSAASAAARWPLTLSGDGVNVVAVQQLLGHERLDTTAVYLTAENQELRIAVESLERSRER